MIPAGAFRGAVSTFLISLLSITGASAQESNTIAILDFAALGIANNDAVVLTSRLRSLLVQSSPYTVIERERMMEILQEQDFHDLVCTSNECAIEIGQLVDARFILAGEIGKLSNFVTLDARVIDVATTKIVKTFSWDKSGGNMGSLLREGIPYIADQIRNISGFGAGSITILTDPPGASIIFDGVEHPNKTPAIISNVLPGSHEILLSRYMNNYGEVEIRKEVSISPNTTLTLNEEFKKYMTFGALVIDPTPNNIRLSMRRTRVAAGGRERGQTTTVSSFPIILDNLAAGQYIIKLYNNNYEREFSVPVGPNQTTRVDLSLFKKTLDTKKKLGDPGYELRKETRTVTTGLEPMDIGSNLLISIGFFSLIAIAAEDRPDIKLMALGISVGGFLSNAKGYRSSTQVPDKTNIAYNKNIKSKLANHNAIVERQNAEISRYNNSLPDPKITILDK